jgi:hypothetical protein
MMEPDDILSSPDRSPKVSADQYRPFHDSEDNQRDDSHTSSVKYTCLISPSSALSRDWLTRFDRESEFPLHEVNEQITASSTNTSDYVKAIQEGRTVADGTEIVSIRG